MSEFIDSREMLTNYLSNKYYSILFTDNFMEQLFEWKANDAGQYKYFIANEGCRITSFHRRYGEN